MKRKLNNKGFTLIELLVTMTILSIITAMAIPLLRNVTNTGTNRKYTTFQDNVIYASKLYVDSYEEDLFDNRDSGCAYIDIEQLIDKKLAKDINIDNTSCKTTESYVQVVKVGNKYTYTPYITCGSINEDGSINNNSYTYPEGKHVKDTTACGGFDSEFNMNITPSIEQTEESSKKKAITINVNSYTGINPNMQIYYGFTSSSESTVSEYAWQKVSFDVPTIKEQKKIISAGTSPSGIQAKSSEIFTPDGYNGSVYLILRVDMLIDLYGESWSKLGSKIQKYGPYRIDNSAPVVNSLTITKENGKWKYDANIADDTNFEQYIGICPNASLGLSCEDKSDFIFNYNTANDVTSYVKMTGVRDSGWGELCIKAIDYAGNISPNTVCSTKASYNVRMYYNDGTNDYETRTVEFNSRNDVKLYGELTSARPRRSRSGYTFRNWAEDPSYGLTKSDVPFTGAVDKLYALWDLDEYTITLKNIDNFGKSTTTTYNVETTKTLDNLDSVPGFTFDGWTARNMASPYRNYTIPKGTTGNLEFYANFSAKRYRITLTGLGTSNQTINYTTNDTVTIPNPTRSGYTFKGWTGPGYTTPTKNLTLPRYTYGNKTFTANWE